MEVVIVTGDRDSFQLVSEKVRIKLPVTRGGRTETLEYDLKAIVEQYGVTPRQMIDVKALMGDASDNIPGVKGIGEKTALKLIQEFGSLENLYENLEKVSGNSVRGKLVKDRETAFLSRKLAEIARNVQCFSDIKEFKFIGFNDRKLLELFRRLEFNSLIERLKLTSNDAASDLQVDVKEIGNPEELRAFREVILETGEVAITYGIEEREQSGKLLVGIGMCCGNGHTVYVNLTADLDAGIFLKEFREVFENEAIKKYAHDIKSLLVYLKENGIDFKGLAFDTMIGAYLIDASSHTYTVSELGRKYLGINAGTVEELTGKGRNSIPLSKANPEKTAQLFGVYSYIVLDVWKKIDSELFENSQSALYYDIELPLVEVLANMEYLGFKVNTNVLMSFSKELQQKIDSVTKEIYEIAGEEFNINSPKQLGVILFDKLGLPVVKKTKTGYSTDAEVLEQLASMHEIADKILHYRQLVKLKSTYVEGLLAVIRPETGRVHSTFNQTVVVTGRISSTEPNLQNIPIKLELGREIRKAFVPEDDRFVLLDADYSQIELRILAHISQDENMIEAFRNNEDIHRATASRVFNISPGEVTPEMRARAKAVNFGIVYGIGDFSLSKDLRITRKEARRYIDGYLNRYPGVKKYMHDIVEEGKKKGFVTTLFNRRRYLPELKSSNFNIRSFGERIALNTPIQGTAADIIKIAMVKVYNELKKRSLKSRLILQVHDELIIEAYRDEAEEVSNILKTSMENAIELSVPLKADVKSGRSWFEAK
jgi:DNA polymerase-1